MLCLDTWVDDEKTLGTFRPFNYAIRKVQAALVGGGDGPLAETFLIESNVADVEAFFRRVKAVEPDVVAASAYLWSFPTFVALAERIKAWREDVLVVLGGPAARMSMFTLRPYVGKQRYVDALALGEGEPVIRAIAELPEFTRAALATVPGLVIPTPTGGLRTPPAQKSRSLDAYPSPYRLGLSPRNVTAHLETFRGCPLSCAFCQWGVAEQASRALSADYIAEELLAFEALGSRGVFLVSAALNLNPIAFRNLVAAEERVGVLRRLPLSAELYPGLIREEHLDFLESVRADNIGIGIQSIDEDVLRLQRRKSFDRDRFMAFVPRIARFHRPVVELILGMPGDTPAKFRETLAWALDLPFRIHISKCLVLPDAYLDRTLADGLRIEFDHDTLQMISCTGFSAHELQELDDELSASYPRWQAGGSPWWEIGPPGARTGSLHRDVDEGRARALGPAPVSDPG